MRNPRGYVLLEVLVGAAIACGTCAVLFQFAVAAQASLAAQGDAADQQQRLRVAIEALRHDLTMAGAGPSRGAARGPLIAVLPPVVPARIGISNPDPELTVRSDRISLVYVPETRAQATLRSPMATASSPIAIDGAPVCTPGTACDFAAGDRAVVYDPSGAGAAHEFLTIGTVDTARDLLMPSAPLTRAYGAGARIALVTIRVYSFDAPGKRLMVYDGGRSDLPLIDRVVAMRVTYLVDPRPDVLPSFPLLDLGGTAPRPLTLAQLTDGPFAGEAPNRFDADLLRVRRVQITLRLRGESVAGAIPDLETSIDVAPPNLGPR
jgi:type II secretory pathway pseudopilin PulG